MIINESKFFRDTKSHEGLKFILENFSDQLKSTDNPIFISHKHGEAQYVYRLKELLKKYGFTGYVDWEDDSMPKETSGETAMKIKKKIIEASKFILIATNAAIESKWCNWEIGFADSHKYLNHIALLALKPDNNNYEGEEYLQIYPSIQTSSNVNENANYYVIYPDGTKKGILEWLKLK